MQLRLPFKLLALVLLLATSDILAQSAPGSGTKEASGAINVLKGLLPGSASSTPPANGGTGGTSIGTGGTGTGIGGTGTGTGGTGTGTGGTGTGTGTGGTGTGTGTGGTGTGTGTGGTGTGTGTGGTGTGTGTGGTGTGTGTGGTGTGTGTGGTGTGTGTGGTGTGTGTGGTGVGTGGTGVGTGGTGVGTGGTGVGTGGTGVGTGGTGVGTGGTGVGTGGTGVGTGGTGVGTGGTGTGTGTVTGGTGTGTGTGGTGTGIGGTGIGTGGTSTGTGGTGTGTGTGNTGAGVTISGGSNSNTSGTGTTGTTAGGGAITMYRTGWNKDRVMAFAKGNRPNPSTYLTEAYIKDHLDRFRREGGSFMIVENWIKKGQFNAFPLRKFVMLRSDMAKVTAKYDLSGRIEDIEDALGYRRGDLKGLDAEIHVINIDSIKYKFELPTGNEVGANDLWEPGAKTSGGYREAVIIDKTDPAKTIVHNKNPEALHIFDFKELIYKQGWYNKRVRDIPKPNRPAPATYLIPTYIANHLQKFNTEGGAFMVVKKWIENPAENFMAFPLKKFVMLKSDMDKVVAKFQQTGDVKEIEDALGYTPGTLTGLEDDLYVFYLDKTKFIFELPTGNEIGANNLWEPEARTSGGFLECVVTDKTNANAPIVHNKKITILQSKFQYIKVAGEGSNAIYKSGWSKSRVMAFQKGSRPNPSTYLTASYVTNHLNLFKTEGGAFMIVEPWIKSSPFPTFALRKFVMLRSDMDKVMAKYYQSGRIEDIEDALGYKRGDLKGKDADIHIIYLDPSKYNFELPDGNEIGANELWEPGAKTSGGYREAVIIDKIDPAKTIVHNKDPEALHTFDFKELIYKQGWYNKKVRDIPKPTRPNPSTYLIPTYIANHLQKFNTEGGAFMVVKKWIENPAENFMAFPLKKFVMLRSDMDKVVAKFQQTGDVKDIEDALGYTPGTLTGLEDDLFVFYLNKTKYLFELPTGNEIGANSLWEPEAHTSGGFLECVVTDKAEPNKPITHNKLITTLQSAFQFIKLSGAGSTSIYQTGWSKSRVIAIAKGSRPKPSTYLTAAYITEHLNLFKTEGGAFMIVEPWIKSSPFPTFPLRKFVMLRSDMEKVMAKYYQSGRIEDIEDALGYKRGDLKGKDADIHIIYLDPSKYNFELPDGNEIGANELWEPGAKTSGGYREAVIIDKSDPAKTIVHNKDPEALQTFEFKELIYKQGWFNKRVREIPKPTRPNPADYLIPSYITNHLQKFDTEGGAFMVVKKWIEDPTQTFTAFPLKKFVMLRSDMDAVVAKYRLSNNVKDIEDALGYTPGTLAGLEDDLYVFYLDKSKYIFELPTGNEIGANSLWEPEAHTSGGFLECVVTDKTDPNKPITHNKTIPFLQSQFTNIKVKQ